MSPPGSRAGRGLTLAAWAGLALLGLSHLGAVLPPGDAVAVARPALLMGAVPVLALLARPRPLLAGLVAAAVAGSALATAAAWRGSATGPPGSFVLYQKNLLLRAWPRDPLTAEILASGADVVTLQEVSNFNLEHMAALFAAYPAGLRCEFSAVGRVAVLSRHPFVPGTADCGDRDGLALAQVVLPDGGRLWVAALHLRWPWPYGGPRQLPAVLARLRSLSGPVLLAGDFNMVPWGAAVEQVAEAAGAERLGGVWSTFMSRGMPLPIAIDHVLVPAGATGQVELRPWAGSDHRGLLARIALQPISAGSNG